MVYEAQPTRSVGDLKLGHALYGLRYRSDVADCFRGNQLTPMQSDTGLYPGHIYAQTVGGNIPSTSVRSGSGYDQRGFILGWAGISSPATYAH